jgi:hypothetical protein
MREERHRGAMLTDASSPPKTARTNLAEMEVEMLAAAHGG